MEQLHTEVVDALLQMSHVMSHDFRAISLIAFFSLDLYFFCGSCYDS